MLQNGDYKMSKEVPFKSMKITLSEEAVSKLLILRQGGAFRSDSATIEECIRFVSDVASELIAEMHLRYKDGQVKPLQTNEQAEMLKRIMLRLVRFTAQSPILNTLK